MSGVSATKGLPPPKENRPVTGERPDPNTAARDSSAPLPVLSKYPVTTTPFAWLRRKPGKCAPTARNASTKLCRVRARGLIQLFA